MRTPYLSTHNPPAPRALGRAALTTHALLRTALVLLAIGPLLSACIGAQTPQDDGAVLAAGDTWFRDVTLVTAERQSPLQHAHVVVRGDRIVSVGTDAPDPDDASGVTVIEGAGKYLVPGLIDGHVHLADVPGMSPEQRKALPDVPAAYYRQLPRSYLYFGFTTVVDLNVTDPERIEQVRRADLGPDVFDCGNALPLANGYPMVYVPQAARFDYYPNFLYDPRQADAIPSQYSANDHSPEAAVQRVADAGGVCVKAFYEPGFDPKVGKLPVPTEKLIRQVRESASRRDLPLLLHANSLEAHRFAVAVEAAAVVHGLWNWGETGAAEGLPDEVREVLDAERRRGIAYMPTMRVLSGLADLFNPDFLDDPHLAHVLPEDLLDWYRTPDARWFANEVARGFDGLPAERIRARFAEGRSRQEAIAYVLAQGGRIVFGSDTPSAPTYANPPGYNGYLELRELEAAGMSPQQILAAATVENARLFGLAGDYGTIEPGKVASLLVLHDDPLASTAAFDTIETVMVRGRVVPRAALAVAD